MADNKTTSDIRLAAMNLLAMREHSAHELRRKLAPRFEGADVAAVIAVLTAENLQSDERYTEAFIIMRKRQGKGPIRIALELKEKGIGEAIYILILPIKTGLSWLLRKGINVLAFLNPGI